MKSLLCPTLAIVALGTTSVVSGGSSFAASPSPASEGEEAAAPAANIHGFVQIMAEALTDVTLKPAQEEALQNLADRIDPLQAQLENAETETLLVLAEQVKARHIDRAALQPKVQAYVVARAKFAVALRAAVSELHAMLDPAQREDFADSLECGVHRVILAATSGERLDAFAEKIDLTPEQKTELRERLQTLVPLLEHERRSVHSAIEGFRGDSFSIESYLPLNQVPEKARLRAMMIVEITEWLVNTLNREQTEKLAATIADAAHAAEEPTSEAASETKSEEHVGTAAQHWWAAGRVRRGPWGGVRRGVVVGGSAGYYWRRGVYPVAAGWGWGW